MTIEKLLSELKNQREAVNNAIHLIEHILAGDSVTVKRARLVKAIRYSKKRYTPKPPKSYNGKHWMQQPENRAKMLRQLKKMQRGKRTTKK